jgi:undecaprenyl-diphosphatase
MPKVSKKQKLPVKKSRVKKRVENDVDASSPAAHPPIQWQSVFSVIFGLIFIGLSAFIGLFHTHKAVLVIDWLATYAIASLQNESVTQVMKVVSDFGYYGAIGIWMGLLGAGVASKRWFLVVISITLAVVPYLAGFGMKYYFERERPILNPLVEETYFSYPSLHALSAAVLFLTLAYVIYHYTGAYWRSMALLIFGIVATVAIAFSRIYLGVHYFSDVFGGILLGGGLFLIMVTIIKAFFDRRIKLHIAHND